MMKHARDDYDRIQDPSGLIPEEEPVFLLRGQDRLAPMMLRLYADAAEIAGVDEQVVKLVRLHASRMDFWQLVKASKLADLP